MCMYVHVHGLNSQEQQQLGLWRFCDVASLFLLLTLVPASTAQKGVCGQCVVGCCLLS